MNSEKTPKNRKNELREKWEDELQGEKFWGALKKIWGGTTSNNRFPSEYTRIQEQIREAVHNALIEDIRIAKAHFIGRERFVEDFELDIMTAYKEPDKFTREFFDIAFADLLNPNLTSVNVDRIRQLYDQTAQDSSPST